MFKRILVPLDGSELAERALPYAIGMVRASNGQVTLLRVEQHPELSGEPGEAREAESYLHHTANAMAGNDVAVEPRARLRYLEGVPEAIAYAVRDFGAEAVVMSTHGRSGLDRVLYGSVAEALLASVEVPILLISARTQKKWADARLKRILVPLDGSGLAEGSLELATALAHSSQADLTLLQVIEPPAYAYTDALLYTEEDLRAVEAGVREYLEEVAARFSDPRVEIALERGQASGTIARVARERDIDLIVMATHGRGGLRRLILGSTAVGTLREATVPLLVLRPAAMRRGGVGGEKGGAVVC